MNTVFLVMTDYYSETHAEKAFALEEDAKKYSNEQNEKYGTKSKWWVSDIDVQ